MTMPSTRRSISHIVYSKMTDQQRMAAVTDWLAVRRIWTQTAQKEASKAAGAALDDFLIEHNPPSGYKAKE